MELKQEYIKLPKDMVYDMYESIVYDTKDYDNITRSKMLDAILKEYNQQHYLVNMCTIRELVFLEYALNNKLKAKDLEKYEWEIEELNGKCIFSRVTLEIFEEQTQNVKEALDYYKKHKEQKKNIDEMIILMIGLIKTNVEMLTPALKSLITSISNINDDGIEHLFGCPLFHYYCEFRIDYLDSLGEVEIINYRRNWNLLDDLFELRKEYGLAGSKQVDFRDYYDMFYYGLPIRKPKVKKMYDAIRKAEMKNFLLSIIDEARILNERTLLYMFVKDDDLLKIIDEGLDDTPCAVMNGYTPNEYTEEKLKEKEFKFNKVPQNNAHLCRKEADEFYKLYFALLEYTNNKYHIEDSIDKIYKQIGLDVNQLIDINRYVFNNKNVIDEFIKDNPYKFNQEELDIVEGFKQSVYNKHFVITGFDREYTEFLSDDGKLYMVKGVRDDLDKIFKNRELPIIVETALLMYKDKIIYNSFFVEVPIRFGNDIKEAIMNDYDKAIRYYHL